jgi:hypothetical protein
MMVWTMPHLHPGVVLVHFLGDSSIAVDLPHGNSKSDHPRPFYRTLPSTFNEMRETGEQPATFYRRKRAEVGSDIFSQV